MEQIDLGEGAARQVVSGLVKHIPIDQMQGRAVVVLANLKPNKLRGVESQAVASAPPPPLSPPLRHPASLQHPVLPPFLPLPFFRGHSSSLTQSPPSPPHRTQYTTHHTTTPRTMHPTPPHHHTTHCMTHFTLLTPHTTHHTTNLEPRTKPHTTHPTNALPHHNAPHHTPHTTHYTSHAHHTPHHSPGPSFCPPLSATSFSFLASHPSPPQAMVLCGTSPDGNTVELVEPPAGAAVGERVSFEGHEGEPDDVLNPKKKIWEKV